MSHQKPCLAIPEQRRRKRDDGDGDDGGDDDGTTTNFDDIDSLDATSYLSRVMEQARRLPEVFESSEPAAAAAAARSPLSSSSSSSRKKFKRGDDTAEVITGSAASLHFLVSSSSAIQPPPTTQHLPAGGLQWVERTMASFSDLRSYLEQCHDQGVGRDKSQRIPVPPMKDRMGWYSFCVGPDAAAGNVGGYYDDDDDKASDKDSDGDAGKDPKDKETHRPAWKRNGPPPSGGYTPTVSLVLQLDQVMVRRVLGHLTHYYCCDSNHKGNTTRPLFCRSSPPGCTHCARASNDRFTATTP